jgi:hypothetical protein
MKNKETTPGLTYTDIITGNLPEDMDAWREYQEFYIDTGMSNECTFEWYRDMIRPYRDEYDVCKKDK